MTSSDEFARPLPDQESDDSSQFSHQRGTRPRKSDKRSDTENEQEDRNKPRSDYRPRRPERRSYSPENVDDALEATSSLPERPRSFENRYHQGDKIAEDYQDRHRGDSIWTSGYPSNQRPTSGEPRSRFDREKNPDRDRNGSRDRSDRGARPDRGNRPGRPGRNMRQERPSYMNRPSAPDMSEPSIGARGRRGEPITLAEELSLERQNHRHPAPEPDTSGLPESEEKQMFISQLGTLSTDELISLAREENMELLDGEPRQDLIFRILKQRIRSGGLMFGEGTLEILPNEFGFLRNPDYHYLSCPDDIYISPSQIRRFGLRNGLTVSGQIRPPKERERYFALLRVEAINHEAPAVLSTKIPFDALVAMHPSERITLEHDASELSSRVIDLTVPLGFGQRGLIVSPPRAGKTILLQKIAKAVLTNYPESYVFMLLIDERPEEVTDMERELKGPHCEVVSSTFDEPVARHIQVSEMVLEKAKRMVEYGKDVVIFLDSITRLARAWNAESPDSGKTLSGGVDIAALTRPKKFFGSARKIENGGSLTIIATALVDTGSQMDEVIFEEFKGTGNLEIRLDRSLVDERLWPAINIIESGTRRAEMILDSQDHERMSTLRRQLVELNPVDALGDLIDKLGQYETNAEFLMSLNSNQEDAT